MNKFSIEKTVFSVESLTESNLYYDLGIFFNSSESRALSYSNLFKKGSIKVAILVDFDGKGNTEKEKNLQINITNLKRISELCIFIPLDSIFDYLKNLDIIAARIFQYRNQIEGKSYFMDITGAPLIYSVAITKFIFRLFPVPSLSLLNVSGRYAQRGQQQFSEGEQFDMYIPGYFGTPDHSKQLHYVFLLGYDGDRSMNIYRDNLPDKVSVIIPSPGYDEGNDLNTIIKNRDFLIEAGFLFKDGKLPKTYSRNRNLHFIDISDIESVMKLIDSIYEADKDNYEIRLVPLGPKPHAIGSALAAIFNNDLSIMYQVPKKYFMSEIPHGDKMWLYKIDVV